MSLTQALATSLSGLTATQTNLSIVAGNVANAQTPGYIALSAVQVATIGGNAGDGVSIASINRLLDQFVQQQLRSESSGGAYADLRANFYQQLQQIYGQPGSNSSLDFDLQQLHARRFRPCRRRQIRRRRKTRRSVLPKSWRSSSTMRRTASKRFAARPTRESPAMSSRPTTPCNRLRISIRSYGQRLGRQHVGFA